MSKLKKVLLTVGVYAVVAALAIGGTVAYLQDDDSAVNVMTLGEVKIDQLEYERIQKADGTYEMVTSAKYGEGYKLQEFTDDKPLYPAVGTITGWGKLVPFDQLDNGASGGQKVLDGINNVQDKFVLVKNTGKTDAYVRTFIALEYGSNTKDIIGISRGDFWKWNSLGIIEVDGNNYDVFEAIYQGSSTRHLNGVLPAGEYTYNSLGQIYLSNEATNEDCANLDGNGNGKYDILVCSQAVQVAGFEDAEQAVSTLAATAETVIIPAAKVALDEAFGEPMAIHAVENDENVAVWLTQTIEDAKPKVDTWDGTADTTWYNDTDTEFVLTTSEQLAGFSELIDAGNTFEGKTIVLANDLDLYIEDVNGEPICFDPIGSYRNDNSFKGTFDGQNHTISGMSQNTWALDNGYYYGDLGLGLFGKVEDATIKNLVMDKASISGESAICGTVAACAYGDCTFENITVKNSQVNDYLYYAGGIVGWASGNHTYKNISVDASATIGGQWGDFGNANGGLIGGIGSTAQILFEDCTVACRIDAVNDVVSAYQWYNYRNSGMLIGRVPQTITNGEVQTVATPTNVTCKNVTVIYDDWANYHYCEFAGTGYPYVRVEAGVSVDAYSNVRYGHPTDANGNTVVDDNHVHNDGEAHHELIAFDQLFGGPADHRYCYYGISEFEGVTVVYNNK